MQETALHSPVGKPWKRRLTLFVGTWVVCSAAGLAFTYLRPAVYRSTATLSVTRRTTSSERNPNGGAAEQDINAVAVQRHVASHPTMISQVFDRFRERGESLQPRGWEGREPSFAEVDTMLSAHTVPETNLLELRAEGGQPGELTLLVETWIELYLAQHAAAERKTTESTSGAIHKQLGELEIRVEQKRRELATFRETHDIASMQREENRVLARLNGLTKSLSVAEEAAATTEARVDAIKSAFHENQPLGFDEEDEILKEMEARAADAQEWLHEQEAVFSPEYLADDQEVGQTKKFLAFLDGAIQDRRSQLERRILSNAEFELAAARRAVVNIRGDLAEQEQTVSEFTTRFSEHEALTEDLAQLEELSRRLREQIVQTEVMRDALPPELVVARHASVPLRPIRPDYHRDALISLAVSFLCGLAAVVIDWLATRPPRPSAQLQMLETRTVYYPLLESQMAGGHAAQAIGNTVEAASMSVSARALEHRAPRELSPDEVTALLNAGEPTTRALLGLLLSGLSTEEVRALRWSDLDRPAGSIRVLGKEARSVTIAPTVKEYLEKYSAARGETEGYVWQDASAQPLTEDAVRSLVVATAHVAGIQDAFHVDAEVIRHTYVAFLARQGLPLTEIVALVGLIPNHVQQHYEILQLPGLHVTAADANLLYTSLAAPSAMA